MNFEFFEKNHLLKSDSDWDKFKGELESKYDVDLEFFTDSPKTYPAICVLIDDEVGTYPRFVYKEEFD